MRPVLAALLLACCLTITTDTGAAADGSPVTSARERRQLVRGAQVLRDWDERRAAAWAAADAAALRRSTCLARAPLVATCGSCAPTPHAAWSYAA